ncbi:NAD-dependent epimerase/dehydratase family protein [Rossellomorea aquimaris]|uniref:NAD-dependent epimerase/dehydratase family protein n=1 Tax=Rossellomorea aquimaris TaxID=189382 RepID=UPI0007D0870B|nr:NAD-dependent epimerase/dehydratase family protein [Rossellomorea aquimaris]
MKILIIGGTNFVGRHFAEEVLKRGHELTLFNRGQTNPELFPEAIKLQGDRDGNLGALKGREWDVVIDTCGYVPRVVEQSLQYLKDQAKQYVFISTISVYRDFKNGRNQEAYPVGVVEDPTIEKMTGETYGPLKAACEQLVRQEFPENHLIIRPGLIVGPFDPTDRFTYWLDRFSKGGDMVIPGAKTREIQWVDVRDLVQWTLTKAEESVGRTFNVTGPSDFYTMEDFIDDLSKEFMDQPPKQNWIEDSFLIKNDIQPFTELPLWVPVNDETPDGYILADITKAKKQGLSHRSPRATIQDTWEWHKNRNKTELKAGLKEEKESHLLTQWKQPAKGEKSTT